MSVSATDRDFDVVIVGGGVVGLAAAAALGRAGAAVLVLERHSEIARETTSRNSEVVHAGIYYPPDSLKAELCRAGREALYPRCEARGVPFRRIGKLIVASEEQELPALARIEASAAANGVALEPLDAAQVHRLEPEVRAVAALLSPETGIVDAHAYALSFLAEAEAHGVVLARETTVEALEPNPGGWAVVARSARRAGQAGDLQRLTCRGVVNAAGLDSDRVAGLAGLDVEAASYRLHYCKGDYFALAPGAGVSISRLIYPIPDEAGLGIHATLDLNGRVRFGPDTEFVSRVTYHVDPAKGPIFAAAAARYLPKIRAAHLSPDSAGVRPKLSGPGEGFADFVVCEESARGLPGLVNCIGIESPGLTAASAIADRVRSLLHSVL